MTNCNLRYIYRDVMQNNQFDNNKIVYHIVVSLYIK